MVVGMLLASVAFVIAAFVQMEIDVSTALAAARTRTLAQTLRLRSPPCRFQKTLPNFPAASESQVKFINMLDRKINFTAGDQAFSMEPFTVGLRSCARVSRGLRSPEEELKTCVLLQARDSYTTFTGRFNLSLEPGALEEISLDPNTRNTLVIIEEMGKPTYVEVCVARGAFNGTALWRNY